MEVWQILMVLYAMIMGFSWGNSLGFSDGQRDAIAKERMKDRRRKLLASQENLGGEIANAMRRKWGHRFNAVGYRCIDGDKTTFKVAVRSGQQFLLGFVVDLSTCDIGEVAIENESGTIAFYPADKEGVDTAIKVVTRALHSVPL